ncbi:hypothetical protein IAE33_003511 [Pseudomonas sp. S60]|uniref:NEL-type E3 ubiquitin ligase domain-containing protein n=1 Tax=Pseudomonas sp. S60 TaxID=211124 RepID=UPI001913D039|nr:NEL-type E3 ubiquitin ligase domain-containing protein [Pseudomonas sp. S60]MBK5011651.1 hypothetical protein [Pseudomonas sp. S60]
MANPAATTDHIDGFIAEHLPDWLHAASVEQIVALRTRFEEHRVIEQRLQTVFNRLVSPEHFARAALTEMLEQTFKLKLDLAHTVWRERWENYSFMGGESLRNHDTYDPAMSHLMQNFPSGASFNSKTGLVSVAHRTAANPPEVLVDTAQLVVACRKADVGKRYQQYLDGFLDNSVTTFMAQDQRKRLALAVELAGLQQGIDEADVANLEHTLGELPAANAKHPAVLVKHLYVLGHAMLNGLLIELSDAGAPEHARPTAGLLLYLPHLPLQRFADLGALNAHMATLLRNPHNYPVLLAQVALSERVAFEALLKKRLSDPVPDLEVTGKPAGTPLFSELAGLHVQRIKDDARFILVPVAEVDAQQRLHRLQTLEGVGLNLLQMASMFVPQLGTLMLAATVGQVIEEVYQGVNDWSRGHQHEALEHMLGVAEVVAVNALGAAGGHAVARSFKRSAFVDELVPVEPNAETANLWSQDIKPFRAAQVPSRALRGRDGLFHYGDRRWWLNEGHYHEVHRDPLSRQWRLLRSDRQKGFAPTLQWNGEYGWRLSWQHPQEWHGQAALLGRLWPISHDFDAERITQVLSIADVDETALRRLVSEQRVLPVPLRDTLERFAADRRIDEFFRSLQVGQEVPDTQLLQWCSEQLPTLPSTQDAKVQAILQQAPTLREKLMLHLTDKGQDKAGMNIIQRDFPGLPSAYAADLLLNASADQQARLSGTGRLDLAMAEAARLALQNARVCRALQGLYLNNAYHPDTASLVFALLRKSPGWPRQINVQVREGSAGGRLIAELYPSGTAHPPKVLVWGEGKMTVHENGQPLDLGQSGGVGLLETLLDCLPAADKTRLGWAGEGGVAALRDSLQQRLPADRAALRRLLGIEAIKPTFRSPDRLPDRRFGYLLSGRGTGNHLAERTLQDRVRSLYPGFSERQLELFLNVLDEQPGSPFTVLLDLEREYLQLDQALDRWTVDTAGAARRPQRRMVADELRRCWRFQGLAGRRQPNGDPGMVLVLSGLGAGDLPDLSGQGGFTHVSELALANMQLSEVPAGFLQPFRSVRALNLDNNALTSLPQTLSRLLHLQELTLSRNVLRLDAASFDTLAGMSRLSVLDLSENRLGNFGLALDRLPRLRQLGLRGVGLTQVPAHLERAVSLEYVDLRDNHISELPATLSAQRAQWRQRIALVGNPLPDIYRDLWVDASHTSDSELSSEGDAFHISRWMEHLDAEARALRTAQWNRLLAEPGSGDFFTLVGELTDTSDFRLARGDLEGRLWAMFDTIEQHTGLREQMFALASEPRTCVDSVISSFGLLEVRLLSAAVEGAAGGDAEGELLSLARRFFRLDQVEAYARQDMSRRETGGENVDQIEVSLAYRVGLASKLDLPGQARTMEFESSAGVSQQDLDAAEAHVRKAEAGEQLVKDISERGFWSDHLQARHGAVFEAIREPFAEQMERLYADRQSMIDAVYDRRAKAIAKACDSAVKAKMLELTRQAMARQAEAPLG